jgi:hypothetical protein
MKHELVGKPLMLQDTGKRPGGPGRTLLVAEVCVVLLAIRYAPTSLAEAEGLSTEGK